MTVGQRPDDGEPTAADEATDLADQLRELAGDDPAEARRVVAEVLAALDRASGGVLRPHLPDAIALDGDTAGSPRPTLDS